MTKSSNLLNIQDVCKFYGLSEQTMASVAGVHNRGYSGITNQDITLLERA